MLTRDTVVQQIRLDMRKLVADPPAVRDQPRAVDHLLAAARAGRVRRAHRADATAGQSLTLYLLNALQAVLTARNSLIQTWVSYETARMSLYRDFDLMDIDANGVWTNENDPTAVRIALEHARTAPALSLAIPAGLPDLSPDAVRQQFLRRRRARTGQPQSPTPLATDSRRGPSLPPRCGDSPEAAPVLRRSRRSPPPPVRGPFAPAGPPP